MASVSERYAMTEAERFTFDLSGVRSNAANLRPGYHACDDSLCACCLVLYDRSKYLIRPAIISPEQVANIRAQVLAIHRDPMSLPPEHRHVPGGPSALLVDHPAVLGVLHEIIGAEVRIENPNCVVRERGEMHGELHGGGPTQIDPIFGYREYVSIAFCMPVHDATRAGRVQCDVVSCALTWRCADSAIIFVRNHRHPEWKDLRRNGTSDFRAE